MIRVVAATILLALTSVANAQMRRWDGWVVNASTERMSIVPPNPSIYVLENVTGALERIIVTDSEGKRLPYRALRTSDPRLIRVDVDIDAGGFDVMVDHEGPWTFVATASYVRRFIHGDLAARLALRRTNSNISDFDRWWAVWLPPDSNAILYRIERGNGKVEHATTAGIDIYQSKEEVELGARVIAVFADRTEWVVFDELGSASSTTRDASSGNPFSQLPAILSLVLIVLCAGIARGQARNVAP